MVRSKMSRRWRPCRRERTPASRARGLVLTSSLSTSSSSFPPYFYLFLLLSRQRPVLHPSFLFPVTSHTPAMTVKPSRVVQTSPLPACGSRSGSDGQGESVAKPAAVLALRGEAKQLQSSSSAYPLCLRSACRGAARVDSQLALVANLASIPVFFSAI